LNTSSWAAAFDAARGAAFTVVALRAVVGGGEAAGGDADVEGAGVGATAVDDATATGAVVELGTGAVP